VAARGRAPDPPVERGGGGRTRTEDREWSPERNDCLMRQVQADRPDGLEMHIIVF
jgi:hypothetical protein